MILALEMSETSGIETRAAPRVVLYTGDGELPEPADDVRPDNTATGIQGPRFMLAAVRDPA